MGVGRLGVGVWVGGGWFSWLEEEKEEYSAGMRHWYFQTMGICLIRPYCWTESDIGVSTHWELVLSVLLD